MSTRIYVGSEAAANFRAGSAISVSGTGKANSMLWIDAVEYDALILSRPWWLGLYLAWPRVARGPRRVIRWIRRRL